MEQYYTSTPVSTGEIVNIFKDPSRIEFKKLIREFGFARGVVDNSGDIYIWNGEILHHLLPEYQGHHLEWNEYGNISVTDGNGEPLSDEDTRRVLSLPTIRRLQQSVQTGPSGR